MTGPPIDLTVSDFHERAGEVVSIEVVSADGSTPREAGAWMLANAAGETFRTIGGGRLEHDAVVAARAMLVEGVEERMMDVALGPAIGQCCGGRVALRLRRSDDVDVSFWMMEREHEEARTRPQVIVFGHGHVGQALAAVLRMQPVRLHVVETRPDFGGAGVSVTPLPEEVVDAAPPGAAYLVLTHDHALDYLIVDRILARGDAAYVGLIGSKTKRATFASRMKRDGHPPERFEAVTCPIGTQAPRDKRPEVIALFAAAEVTRALLQR